MLQAKRLLVHTSLSVKEIADRLGIADCAYFSRLFTQTAGVSPTLFRPWYMACLGCGSYPVEPGLAGGSGFPRRTPRDLVQGGRVKRYRKQEPDNSCPVDGLIRHTALESAAGSKAVSFLPLRHCIPYGRGIYVLRGCNANPRVAPPLLVHSLNIYIYYVWEFRSYS